MKIKQVDFYDDYCVDDFKEVKELDLSDIYFFPMWFVAVVALAKRKYGFGVIMPRDRQLNNIISWIDKV